MNAEFLITSLAGISVLTSLTVQAIKKILDEKQISYSANLLAIIVSIVLTIAVSIGYIIYMSIIVTPQIIITIIALIFLAFLSATVGYDKVVQLLKQLGGQ